MIGEFGVTNFEGLIDEASIYSSALSNADVLAIYNGGAPTDIINTPQNATLTNWWRMGDVDAFPTLTDQRGTDDITLTNMIAGDIVTDAPAAGLGAPTEGSVYWSSYYNCVRTFSNGVWVNLFPLVEWDNSRPYYFEQIVEYSGELFQCTAEHISSPSPATIYDDIANWHPLTQHDLNELTNVDTTGAVENDVIVLDNAGVYRPEAKGTFKTPLTVPVISVEPATPVAGYVVLWADDNMTVKAKYETGEVVEMLKQYNVVDFLDTPLLDASLIDNTAVAYLTVVASLASDVKAIQIYDTAGINLGWYDGSDNLLYVSGPGTNETTQVEIPAGTLIKVRPLEASASAFSGRYTVNFLG